MLDVSINSMTTERFISFLSCLFRTNSPLSCSYNLVMKSGKEYLSVFLLEEYVTASITPVYILR